MEITGYGGLMNILYGFMDKGSEKCVNAFIGCILQIHVEVELPRAGIIYTQMGGK